MSLPTGRIFAFEDLTGSIPGSVTISNRERLDIWHNKIWRKFRKSIANCSENQMNFLIGEYKRLIQDQSRWLCEKTLLLDKIIDHLFALYICYRRLKNKQLIKTTVYLDYMEKFLGITCDLEMEILSVSRPDALMRITQQMISCLHILSDTKIRRILHVLLRAQCNNKFLAKSALNVVYKYFLVNFPITDAESITFCLHYLLYQRWNKFKTESASETEAIIKLLLYKFKSTSEEMMKSAVVTKILKPAHKEMSLVVDLNTSTITSCTLQYFKQYNLIKQPESDPSQLDNCVEDLEGKNPYQMDFVHTTHFKSLRIEKDSGNSNNVSMPVDVQTDIILIEDDDDDSDVEMVPLNQDLNETLTNVRLSNAVTAAPEDINPVDASSLIRKIKALSISSKKPVAENGLKLPDFISNRTEVTSVVDIVLQKLLISYFAGHVVPEEQFNTQFGTDSNLQVQENYSVLSCVSRVDTTAKNSESSNRIEKVVALEQVLEPSRSPSKQNVKITLCEKVSVTKLISDEMHTNEDTKNGCNYNNLSEEEIINSQSPKDDIDEIHTQHITALLPKTWSGIETPPSDAENNGNPCPLNFGFCSDSQYSQKNVDVKMQSYADNINNGNGEITETVKGPFNVLQHMSSVESTLSESECIFEDTKACVGHPSELLINTSLVGADNSRILEPEVTDNHQCSQSSITSDVSMTFVNSEECFNSNTTTIIVANNNLVSSDVKKKANKKLKKGGNKSRKTKKASNPTYPLSEFDKFTSHPNVLANTYGVTSNTLSSQNIIGENADLIDASRNMLDSTARELSPSPAYEVIPTHELRKHLREIKRVRTAGSVKVDDDNANQNVQSHNNSNIAVRDNCSRPRSAISTRSATRRKCKTHVVVTKARNRRVNVAGTDATLVPKRPNYPRRISYSLALQVKDSMFMSNICRFDNKLIFLEMCLPCSIIESCKYLEACLLRRLHNYEKNANNLLIDRSINIKADTPKASTKKTDYNKCSKSENLPIHSSIRYNTITFHATQEPGLSIMLPCGRSISIWDYTRTEPCTSPSKSIATESRFKDPGEISKWPTLVALISTFEIYSLSTESKEHSLSQNNIGYTRCVANHVFIINNFPFATMYCYLQDVQHTCDGTDDLQVENISYSVLSST